MFGLEGAFQLLLGDVPDVGVGVLLGGVVDQDVEAAELVEDLGHRGEAERLVADVAGDGDGAAAFRLDDALGLRGVVMLAKVKNADVGAFAGEERRHRPADAAVGAGDQRHLALQPPGSRITRLPLRSVLHPAFVAGKGVLMDHGKGFGVAHMGYSLAATPAPSSPKASMVDWS
jgi:hypothetical protein